MTSYNRKIKWCPICNSKTVQIVEDDILFCTECSTTLEGEQDADI